MICLTLHCVNTLCFDTLLHGSYTATASTLPLTNARCQAWRLLILADVVRELREQEGDLPFHSCTWLGTPGGANLPCLAGAVVSSKIGRL